MDLEKLFQIVLESSQSLNLDSCLKSTVEKLVEADYAALSRIWLYDDKKLTLKASAGKDHAGKKAWFDCENSQHKCFHLGERKVGYIAQNQQAVYIANLELEQQWPTDLTWAKEEKIVSFFGLPLYSSEGLIGVWALFSRRELTEDERQTLRTFSKHLSQTILSKQEKDSLKEENKHLKQELECQSKDYVGSTPQVLELLEKVEMLAPTDTSVLIQGESGTGKELIAELIHKKSQRFSAPFIKVNCAAIPKELFESEFFGHVKGAFTGALSNSIGRFEAADQGTLFLDEVGELAPQHQAKLLRVLQEGEFERVGEHKTRKVSVRIIAATNRTLLDETLFRRDLYYRLAVFPLELPALRERREDILLLTHHFCKKLSQKYQRPYPQINEAQLNQLMAYDWPGNVRELKNVLEQALILSPKGKLNFNSLPKELELKLAEAPKRPLTQAEIDAFEEENFQRVLELCKHKISGSGGAAEYMGVKASTLYSRLRKKLLP